MIKLSLQFWNTLNIKQKQQYATLLEHYKSRSFNRGINRFNRGGIRNAVFGAFDSFCDSHPNSIDKTHKGSLAKRITGTLDAYFKQNKPLKDIIK